MFMVMTAYSTDRVCAERTRKLVYLIWQYVSAISREMKQVRDR